MDSPTQDVSCDGVGTKLIIALWLIKQKKGLIVWNVNSEKTSLQTFLLYYKHYYKYQFIMESLNLTNYPKINKFYTDMWSFKQG
jgi:hypothetical protein